MTTVCQPPNIKLWRELYKAAVFEDHPRYPYESSFVTEVAGPSLESFAAMEAEAATPRYMFVRYRTNLIFERASEGRSVKRMLPCTRRSGRTLPI
jgi:hypothetical protein